MPGPTSTQSTRRISPRASKFTDVWRDTVGCTGPCGGKVQSIRLRVGEDNGTHARGLRGTQGAASILTQPGVPSTLLVSGGDNRAQLWDRIKCR